MVTMSQRERQDAPERLEVVRAFLMTWFIPNDTRVPVDQLSSVEAVERFRAAYFPQLAAFPSKPEAWGEVEILRHLRSDLRQALQSNERIGMSIVNSWLEMLPLTVALSMGTQTGVVITYQPVSAAHPLCGALLALVMEAWALKTWRRLKVCPDCQSVFYDHTKNTNRVWCGMLAHGPDGRACGSIAKARRWRQRHKVKQRQEG